MCIHQESLFDIILNFPFFLSVFTGFFGFIVLGILNVIFFYIDAGAFSKLPTHKLEDPVDAFIQIGNNWKILLATVGKNFMKLLATVGKSLMKKCLNYNDDITVRHGFFP